MLDSKDVSVLHYSWIYPLPVSTIDYLKKAANVIVVENNATAQFAKLIQLSTGFIIKNRILKYNGLPFSVEEIFENIKTMI